MKIQGAIGPKNGVRKAAQKLVALTMASPVRAAAGQSAKQDQHNAPNNANGWPQGWPKQSAAQDLLRPTKNCQLHLAP